MVRYAPLFISSSSTRGTVVGGEGDQGFIIRDRRGKTEEAPGLSGTHASAQPPSHSKETPSRDIGSQEPNLPVTFSTFVISVGTSALMLMGEQIDPQQPAVPVNLPQAKEIIDLLSILEAKTRGNLTGEEEAVLRDMLYALRMKYVSLAPKK